MVDTRTARCGLAHPVRHRRFGATASFRCGHTLVEAMVSVTLLASAAVLVGGAFSFGLNSQQLARNAMEASRLGGQILETLRATSYDSLSYVENGGLAMEPLSKFHQLLLQDIQDRMDRDGLSVYLTIRPAVGVDEAKYLSLTIVSNGVAPETAPDRVPGDKLKITMATLVTRKGINP